MIELKFDLPDWYTRQNIFCALSIFAAHKTQFSLEIFLVLQTLPSFKIFGLKFFRYCSKNITNEISNYYLLICIFIHCNSLYTIKHIFKYAFVNYAAVFGLVFIKYKWIKWNTKKYNSLIHVILNWNFAKLNTRNKNNKPMTTVIQGAH